MDDLTKLAIKYGTDKWGKHHYTPYYYNMFKDRREKVEKVLEIGVGEGAGLRMWRDFFPNAMIYGAEIDTNRLFIEDRIEVIRCDQSYYDDLIYLVQRIGIDFADIDIVIDDGSHRPEDQVFTCKTLMPLLDDRAIYVIEDVADEEILEKSVGFKLVKMLSGYYVNVKKVGDRYDDRLVIVGKNE
jgi:hypothetical protein|tara:strand:- start:959 stop:1513 length:555 start_codon:yes stop_codon:yes gene_type:complete